MCADWERLAAWTIKRSTVRGTHATAVGAHRGAVGHPTHKAVVQPGGLGARAHKAGRLARWAGSPVALVDQDRPSDQTIGTQRIAQETWRYALGAPNAVG